MFAQRQNVVPAQRPGFSTNLYLSPVFDVPVHYDDVAAPVVAIFLNDREIIYQSASNPVFLWLPSRQGLLAVIQLAGGSCATLCIVVSSQP
jgi:hypothetical protein